LRVKHLAVNTLTRGATGCRMDRGLFPIEEGLARLATRSTGRGSRPDLALPLDHRLQGRRQLTTSHVHTYVAPEVERGEHRAAPCAKLFSRERKRHTAIHGILLGLQQVETHLSIVIRRRRGSQGQMREERSAQNQTRAMHARLHCCLLQSEDPGDLRGRELRDVGEHERQANVRRELRESCGNSAFSILPEMLVERAFSRGRKFHHGILG
jgi:hypothetical protein